jgi:hypothetical protein
VSEATGPNQLPASTLHFVSASFLSPFCIGLADPKSDGFFKQDLDPSPLICSSDVFIHFLFTDLFLAVLLR